MSRVEEDARAFGYEFEGECFEVDGVTLVESRDAGAGAAGRAALLKMDEAELACDVEEPPVLVMSPGGDSFSSTWVEAWAFGGASEEAPWEGFDRSFASTSASRNESGPCVLMSLERSRPTRPCASALTRGALGKYCAKLTPGGGRVIVIDGPCYVLHRAAIMIPVASRASGGQGKQVVCCGGLRWPSTPWHTRKPRATLSPRDRG